MFLKMLLLSKAAVLASLQKFLIAFYFKSDYQTSL